MGEAVVEVSGSVATSEEMLLAVERWSRARRLRIGDYPDPARLWEVTMTEPGLVGIAQRDGAGRLVREAVKVSPEVAIAWAIAVEAGLPAVDFGPRSCGACGGRGRIIEGSAASGTDADLAPVLALEGRGWTIVERYVGYVRAEIERDCNPCEGTGNAGQDVRDPARLVLDTAPRSGTNGSMMQLRLAERTAAEHVTNLRPGSTYEVIEYTDHEAPPGHPLWEYRWNEPGDPLAIEALTALADHLQPHAFDQRERNPAREAAGHALAHLVALWLDVDLRETRASVEALTRAWERLTVPCEACDGAGQLTEYGGRLSGSTLPPGDSVVCDRCHGHSRSRGPVD